MSGGFTSESRLKIFPFFIISYSGNLPVSRVTTSSGLGVMPKGSSALSDNLYGHCLWSSRGLCIHGPAKMAQYFSAN